ncbi:MAG TPA: FAD/NAD(P)-binding protein [Burkholderiaceae bacterium]|nr:FAD/NAD(P)-binding protein [Burkholderiaceae bacterium]
MTATILIIGAGFSGAITAVQLLRQAGGPARRVILLNRSGRMARGLAYGTQSPDHTLNVPAGNMSAFDDEPDHFLRYCRSRDGATGPAAFVSRRLYGDYLEHLLEQAETAPPGPARLERMTGQVARLQAVPGQAGLRATLDDGRTLQADRVVLAFGHFPSAHPPLADMGFYHSPRYVRDPWGTDWLAALAPGAPVLLLGTGLTAVDICMSLLNADPARPILAISRRGLLPQPHRQSHAMPPAGAGPAAIWGTAVTVRAQLRAFRRHVAAGMAEGRDWRDALASLRPHTAAIWRAYPERERRRFLRHVQPYWDSHRHRLAPAVHQRFAAAMAGGTVRVRAARVRAMTDAGGQVDVLLQPRGTQTATTVRVAAVVNCTGPCSSPRATDSALVGQLLAQGMIRTDGLGLGLAVAPDCAVLDAAGTPSRTLYYIGPWLKADYWEATAVPELRRYAAGLAATVLAALR